MRSLTFILVLFLTGVTAQYNGNPFTMTHGQMELVYYDAPTVGTPYLDELYKNGITYIGNNSETERLMRYNAYRDEMEFLSKQSKPLKLLKKENIVVELDGKRYEVHLYRIGGKLAKGYFNPLNEGEVVLYFQPRKKLIEAKNIEHGYDDIDPAQYLNDFNYYLKKGDKRLEKINLGKKDLFYLLGDKYNEMKQYVAEHDLKLRKESDALKLIEYYNSL